MIQIDFRDPRPIYEQVRERFRELILSGALPPDSKMPSVRELSSALAINPNTIQRAYMLLESGGWIYSVRGKGSFVSGGSAARNSRKTEVLRKLDALIEEAILVGAEKEEFLALLGRIAENYRRRSAEGEAGPTENDNH